MSEFMEQLNEVVPDNSNKNNVTNLNKGKLKRNTDGTVSKSRNNLILLFRGADPKLDKLFKYNEATKNIEVTRDQELTEYITIKHGLFSDNIINQLWAYLSEEHGLEYKENDIGIVIRIIALSRSYNPIKIMLGKAKATCRDVDPFKVIQKYINIEDSQYNRIVLDLFFRGAIARVYHAGVQFDYCLDFVGKQGTGKSTFLREVFKGFYTEVGTFTEKDDVLKMAESWLVNDDEMVASNNKKTDFNVLKRVITTREIRVRRPYGKTTETIPVDFVFSRTTNDKGHLKDATGDRRFITIDVLPRKKGQPNKITEQDLMDIWGNYFKSYEKNKKLYYDDNSEEGKLITQNREKHKYRDDIIERFEWYLSIKVPEDFYSPKIKKHEQKQYYTDMEYLGVGYRNNADRENGIEWVGTVERDRLSVNDVVYEIFDDTHESVTKIKNKIKMYLENSDEWEYKKTIKLEKFGSKRQTSGYLKK